MRTQREIYDRTQLIFVVDTNKNLVLAQANKPGHHRTGGRNLTKLTSLVSGQFCYIMVEDLVWCPKYQSKMVSAINIADDSLRRRLSGNYLVEEFLGDYYP